MDAAYWLMPDNSARLSFWMVLVRIPVRLWDHGVILTVCCQVLLIDYSDKGKLLSLRSP